MMPERAVSSPVAVTRTRRLLSPLLTVPPSTRSPSALLTGRDSPVIMASFSSDAPWATSPSAGTLEPGRTSTMSPARRSPAGTTRVSPPSPIRSAVSGMSLASASSAPDAWRTLRISSQWPSSITSISVTSSQKKLSPRSQMSVAML